MEIQIKINNFKFFLVDMFSSQIIYYEEFIHNLHFVEIDCFPHDFDYKLSIEISDEDIKIGLVTKDSTIDFSLYDYVLYSNFEAEKFIKKIKKSGYLYGGKIIQLDIPPAGLSRTKFNG